MTGRERSPATQLSPAAADAGAPAFRVLQITDSHVRAREGLPLLGVDTADSLRAVLAQAFAEAVPDLLVASGDLAHDPEPESYRRFRDVLAPFNPGAVLYLPGNHDGLGPLTRTLPGPDTVRLGDWEVLGFDSHADDQPEADLSAEDREALQQRVRASSARFLLLVCHHPPVDVGCPWLDKDRIQSGAELLESLADDTRVRGMVFGHVHQAVETRHRHIALLGAPSTCFQFAPGSPRFAIDEANGSRQPGYRWLNLYADGTVVTEVKRVRDYPLNIDLSNRT